MTEKLKSITPLLQKNQIDALLVTQDVNMTYLLDFPCHDSWLLVTPKNSFYITDSRYISEVKTKVQTKLLKVIKWERSFFDEVSRLCEKWKVQKLGIDGKSLTYYQYQLLKKYCSKSMKLVDVSGIVEEMRAIKTPEEISKIRQAIIINHQIFKYIKRIIRPGLTEFEIFNKVREFVFRQKADFSFDPIIASGPNSSYPHALVTERKLIENELLLTDIGVDLNGYKSDLTRMFVLGRIAPLMSRTIEAVRLAQQAAIAEIKDGVSVAQVDLAARNILKKFKLDQYFIHSTGHGVGLEVHEYPRLSLKCSDILKSGMIVTVEPGVYFPGRFGVRLEEMVLVQQKKGDVISGDYNQ